MSDTITTMNRFAEAGRRLGVSISAALAGYARAISGEARREEAMRIGYQLGLTEDQAREVITAWTHRSPFAVDGPEVRDALVRRALGKEW